MIPFSMQHHPFSRWEQSIAICTILISTCPQYDLLHTSQCADEDRCSVLLLLAALTICVTHSLSRVRRSGQTRVNLILRRCYYQIILLS